MSRSYKKVGFCKDRDSCKWGKRHCNKKIRLAKDIPNGKAYRKFVEPWDFIYDYSDKCTFEEFKYRHYRFFDCKEVTDEELYRQWFIWYKRK